MEGLPKNQTEAEFSKNEEHAYDLNNPAEIVHLFKQECGNDEKIKEEISRYISSLAGKHLVDNYKIVFLFDDNNSISQYHSNKIYEALSGLGQEKDILLVLLSGGGRIEPAYFISKICKRLKKEKFAISIPRRAKSAATLISLGADELHMGLLSELGPIDPQFGNFPALGLSNALTCLARLSSEYPKSSNMFAVYLAENLSLRDLGYFERITESAIQYAERLLEGKNLPKGSTAQSLADHFTNHYKDHGFVIDADEALRLLGKSVIKESTKEYHFGNDVYNLLDFAGFLSKIFCGKTLRYIGGIENGLHLDEEKKE